MPQIEADQNICHLLSPFVVVHHGYLLHVTSYLKPGPNELEIIRDKQKQNITVELETRQRKRESMQL